MEQRKEIRMKDIARELDISIVTVSNALNGKRGVGEQLRKKIKAKAEEMGYQAVQRQKPDTGKKTRTYCIGILMAERYVTKMPSVSMNIYKEVVRCISEKGALTVLESVSSVMEHVDGVREERDADRHFVDKADKDEEMHVAGMHADRCFGNMEIDGILLIGAMEMGFVRRVRNERNVPVIGVGFYHLDGAIDYVVPDDFHEAKHRIRQRIDAGYRKFVFTGNPYASDTMLDCYGGFRSALWENNMEECRITEEDAEIVSGLPGHGGEWEKVLAQNSVDLLMRRLRGDNSGYGVWMTECHTAGTA